jgi:Fe-S cluster assembly protein SufD
MNMSADFDRLRPTLPGAQLPWLRATRARALDRFAETGLPTTKHEDWKYTDVRAIGERHFRPVTEPGIVDPILFARRFASDSPSLVFVDGHYVPEFSMIVGAATNVRIASLAHALRDQPARVEPWLRQGHPLSGFSALNAAFMSDGAFIHIGAGASVDQPVHLLFVSSGLPDCAAMLRNIIVAETGSRATIVEEYIGVAGAAGLTNVATDVVLDAGADVEHYRWERESAAAFHIGVTHVQQARDSRYASHSVTLGARLARHEVSCSLAGEGGECALNGLYVGHGRQHQDHHIRVDHRHPGGTSREWYKGVLDDHARGVFSGRVVVHPQAQRTDAAQENHNLLLSEGSEADSRPQFEIYADNVKCAHGSTVGSIDPEQMFYLRSRALDERDARSLLIYAFAGDVLARMRLAPLRAELERALAQRWLGSDVGPV